MLPALIAGGAALGSGIINYLGGKSANEANAAEGQKNRDFNETSATKAYERQRELRQTAYQDTMEDMRAAGLNPMMAAGQGATGASGAPQASASGIPTHQNTIGAALSSATQSAKLFSELDNINNDTALKGAQATQAVATAHREATTAAKTQKESNVLDATFGATSKEAASRSQKADLDLKYQNTERVLNMIKTGTGAVNDATGAAADLLGGFAKKGIQKAIEEANKLKGVKGWKMP